MNQEERDRFAVIVSQEISDLKFIVDQIEEMTKGFGPDRDTIWCLLFLRLMEERLRLHFRLRPFDE